MIEEAAKELLPDLLSIFSALQVSGVEFVNADYAAYG